MAIEIKAASNSITNKSVAMSTTYAAMTANIPSKCNLMLLSNPDTAINILVSFDAGTTDFTIPPGGSLAIECSDFKARNTLHAKSASGTPNLEFIFGTEA